LELEGDIIWKLVKVIIMAVIACSKCSIIEEIYVGHVTSLSDFF